MIPLIFRFFCHTAALKSMHAVYIHNISMDRAVGVAWRLVNTTEGQSQANSQSPSCHSQFDTVESFP